MYTTAKNGLGQIKTVLHFLQGRTISVLQSLFMDALCVKVWTCQGHKPQILLSFWIWRILGQFLMGNQQKAMAINENQVKYMEGSIQIKKSAVVSNIVAVARSERHVFMPFLVMATREGR